MNSGHTSYQDILKSLLITQDSSNEFLTYDDLLKILCFTKSRPLDPGILKEVFLESGYNINIGINIEDFIDAYINTEKKFRTKVESIKQQLKLISSELIKLKKELIEAKAIKAPEDFNLLTATVLQAEFNCSEQLVARVICDEWEVTTNPVSSGQPWNETFTFNPQNPNDIQIEFWTSLNNTLDTHLASVQVNFSQLQNEEPLEKWFKILPNNPKISQVLIKFHWVRSKIEYLSRVVSENETKIEENRKILNLAEEKHGKILNPLIEVKSEGIDEEISKGLDQFLADIGHKQDWDVGYYVCLYLCIVLSVVSMILGASGVNVFGS